jgi:hypothetical protein
MTVKYHIILYLESEIVNLYQQPTCKIRKYTLYAPCDIVIEPNYGARVEMGLSAELYRNGKRLIMNDFLLNGYHIALNIYNYQSDFLTIKRGEPLWSLEIGKDFTVELSGELPDEYDENTLDNYGYYKKGGCWEAVWNYFKRGVDSWSGRGYVVEIADNRDSVDSPLL